MRSAEVYVDQSQLTTLLNSITNFTPPTPLPLPLKGAESTRFVSCLRRFTDSIFRMDGLLMNSQLCSICSRSCHRRPNLFSSSNYSPSRLQLERISYNYRVSVMMRDGSSFNSAAPSTGALQQDSLGRLDNTLPTKDILDLWGNANAVCFDVDSTVCLDEGIDELAEFCGAGQAVADWTARAMSGTVRFEEALAARLSLFKPSLAQVQEFLEKRPPRISPGIETLVQKLKAKGTDVYLISGGFRQMINPVASILGIPSENIFANQLLFGDSGEFAGFDTNEPTSRSGGKATAVRDIRKSHGYKSLIMIGDGATDLEARQPGGADMFICYGGVQLREAVAAKADWLVFNFRDLINSLE